MSEILNPEVVPTCIAQAAKSGRRDGACERHRGFVRPAFVEGWGWFAYCEEAVEEDRRRDLKVWEAE